MYYSRYVFVTGSRGGNITGAGNLQHFLWCRGSKNLVYELFRLSIVGKKRRRANVLHELLQLLGRWDCESDSFAELLI